MLRNNANSPNVFLQSADDEEREYKKSVSHKMFYYFLNAIKFDFVEFFNVHGESYNDALRVEVTSEVSDYLQLAKSD